MRPDLDVAGRFFVAVLSFAPRRLLYEVKKAAALAGRQLHQS
jgi:hypothetical protein